MVERQGQCGEYGREIRRQAQFQAGLFETSLVALSIPWVRIRCWGGEGGLAVRKIMPVMWLSIQLKLNMVCDPLSWPTTRISSPVGRRRSQRLQRTLILISAITKSSRHSTLGRTRICNTFLHLTSTHACRPAYSAPAQVQVECHQTLMQSPDITSKTKTECGKITTCQSTRPPVPPHHADSSRSLFPEPMGTLRYNFDHVHHLLACLFRRSQPPHLTDESHHILGTCS